MKIAIFSELYFPSIGGQEVRYEQLANVLISRNYEVSVYCIGHENNLLHEEDLSGVHVFRYPISGNYKKPIIKPIKRALIPLIRYSIWVSQILSAHQFDLIIFNQWPLLHIISCPKNNRTRLVIDWCEVRNGKFYQLCQKFLPRFSRFNMAVSQSVCQHIEKVSGKSVFYFPSGINLSSYGYQPFDNRCDISYIGRLEDHKNISFLIEAFEMLCDAGFQENLQIAGQGSAANQLHLQASKSRYVNKIKFLGFVSEDDKFRILEKSKLLVIPSKREGFPRIVAEAMASGLPVVTSEYPENGTSDILSFYNCGYISQPNTQSLYRTIEKAILDWETLSQNGLTRAKELDWNVLVDSFEDQILNMAIPSRTS